MAHQPSDLDGEQNRPAIELPRGFRFAGVAAGIKPSGNPDVSLIVADQPAAAAGVYTRNQVVAAPVVISRGRTPSARVRAVIANSGNANACTGAQGAADATEMCRQVADHLGCPAEDVLVMSTGVIGQPLPMDAVRLGIESALQTLGRSSSDFLAAAEAIRTTDASRKVGTASITLGAEVYKIAAMAKGAGMIAPNMATMLAVLLTDCPVRPADADELLKRVAGVSFNRVSVDGHTSTNDTLLLISSGRGTSLEGSDLQAFETALTEVAVDLAKQLVIDGEGASHVLSLEVVGATDDLAAEAIARLVCGSPLVKTAITGGDPNWGRIVSAAGNSEHRIDPSRTSLKILDTVIYQNGTPIPFDAKILSDRMKQSPEVSAVLRVGDGEGRATFFASDLTTEYVEFNSLYTT